MTDKIRIVGAFGEGTVDAVQEFVKGLDGVQSVSVLRDGIETYPEADSVKAEQGMDGDTATEETPAEPASTESEQDADDETANEQTAETPAPAEPTA